MNTTPIVRGAGIAIVALALIAVAAFSSGGDGDQPASASSTEPAGSGSAVMAAHADAAAAPVARPRVASEPSTPAGESSDESAKAAEPEMMIVSHGANSEVFEQLVQFRGIAEPGSIVSSGDAVAEIGPFGHWSLELEMKPGANLKTFDVVGPSGEHKRKSIIVNYEPTVAAVKDASLGAKSGKDKTGYDPDKKHGDWVKATSDGVKDPKYAAKAEPPSDGTGTKAGIKDAEFSATQKYGSCGEDPPYDVFSGTAAAGALISITSPYGSATTVADEHGYWKVKVDFPTAPLGETFEVEVTDGSSVRTFSFVHKV